MSAQLSSLASGVTICLLAQRMPPWLACALVLATLLWHARAGTPDQDCLQRLLNGVSNKGVLAVNWTGPDFPCAAPFVGVTCDPGSQQVRALQLRKFGLVGRLPPELASCSALAELDLSGNILTGTIPAELGALSQLTSLNLSANSLEGLIPPELGRCALLAELDLEGNKLTGSIPQELASLQKLALLRLAGNDLSGPIPSNIARWSNGDVRFNSTTFRPGNKGLTGSPLSFPTSHSLSVLGIVFIGLASGLVSLVLSFAAVCSWMRYSDIEKFKSLPEINV